MSKFLGIGIGCLGWIMILLAIIFNDTEKYSTLHSVILVVLSIIGVIFIIGLFTKEGSKHGGSRYGDDIDGDGF